MIDHYYYSHYLIILTFPFAFSLHSPVTKEDFMRALEENQPAFGMTSDEFENCAPNGIINFGSRFSHLQVGYLLLLSLLLFVVVAGSLDLNFFIFSLISNHTPPHSNLWVCLWSKFATPTKLLLCPCCLRYSFLSSPFFFLIF